jgi:hypothetical protein
MPSGLYRFSQILKSVIYGFDWALNPTRTKSALMAIEAFMNQKTNYPKLQKILKDNSHEVAFLDSKEFQDDMQQNWNLVELKNKHKIGSLGYEYSVFMEQLGYAQLQFELANHIPSKIQNYIKMGIKNHDLVHLLFGLYEEQNGKLDI